jgi:hypothetical protein
MNINFNFKGKEHQSEKSPSPIARKRIKSVIKIRV